MARVQKISKRIKRTVRVPAYQLTLTEGEADFLIGLSAIVSGHSKRSPRKYMDRIAGALSEATGLSWQDTDAYKLMDNDEGNNVHFRVYPDQPKIDIAEEALTTLRAKLRGIPADYPTDAEVRTWLSERRGKGSNVDIHFSGDACAISDRSYIDLDQKTWTINGKQGVSVREWATEQMLAELSES